MFDYNRAYKTSRSVFAFEEFSGWCVVAIGTLLALIGFATGGVVMSRLYGGATFAARLIAATPGIGTIIGGIFLVAHAQASRAAVDTAEMTRDMLRLARGESADTGTEPSVNTFEGSSEAPSESSNPPADEVREAEAIRIQAVVDGLNSKIKPTFHRNKVCFHREVRIFFGAGEWSVGENVFSSKEEATKHIDDQLDAAI